PVRVLDQACELIGATGRVLPMCTRPLDMEADVVGLDSDPDAVRTIHGQVAIASTPGRVKQVKSYAQDEGGPAACPEPVRAVRQVDLVVFGPGSWFTSGLPHLLVPELHGAVVRTTANRRVVLNLVPQPGETAGFSPE